jgi:hypothetical protein
LIQVLAANPEGGEQRAKSVTRNDTTPGSTAALIK